MSATDERRMEPADIEGRLDAMQNEIQALATASAAAMAQLASMADEVRTRRLVVVDGHGAERIVGSTTPTASSLSVRIAGDGDELAAEAALEASRECADHAGRPVGASSVVARANLEAGAELSALQLHEDDRWVDGQIHAYGAKGRDGAVVNGRGLRLVT